MTKPSTASLSNGANGLDGTNGVGHEHKMWTSAGAAAFDFRSDVVTTPTPAMLASIQHTTLLDDVFAEDPTTNALESHIAHLTGFAAALLVTSGTMGNQLSVRTHMTCPPHALLTDVRSHINAWEAGGAAATCGAHMQPVHPANGHHLTLADVRRVAVVSEDVHACPTRLVTLENTLAGTVLPLADAQAIAAWCRAQNPPILVHLDGARLWEAVARLAEDETPNATPEEMTTSQIALLRAYCAAADSVSLCFSKGLGAPIGSMIAGSQAFVKRARWVRKSIGGALRQAGVIAAPARVAVDETFLGNRLVASHVQAKRIAAMWTSKGGKLAEPTETNMVWLDIEAARLSKEKFVAVMLEEGLKAIGGRLVVHYQIGDEAVGRLQKMMDRVLKDSGRGKELHGVNGNVEREMKDVKDTIVNVE